MIEDYITANMFLDQPSKKYRVKKDSPKKDMLNKSDGFNGQ